MPMQSRKQVANTVGDLLEKTSSALVNLFFWPFELVFGFLQRLIGVRGMPYLFVLPNLLIFGIFILFPMLLNFVYAFTGGIE